ncbi:MAG: hypothetical protein IIC60_05295 [Proteobacteria bacterium]|nr:hypothetical protein [Pseudomonadota bacterium]
MSTRILILSILGNIMAYSLACAQQPNVEDIGTEFEQSRQLLDQLTESYGRLDRRLLETLDHLSQQLIENERFGEAHEVLNQAIQNIRINDGLYAQAQYPYLIRKIENLANVRDWKKANNSMRHLAWLLNRNENIINQDLIQTILQLTDIHLWGVAEDHVRLQAYHLRSAVRLNEVALRLATNAWGRNDRRLPPIMYKQVLQIYLQSLAVDVGGHTSLTLRTYSDSGVARSRTDVIIEQYYSGLRLLHEMRRLYREQDPLDIEAVALTDMYIADWQVLFSKAEDAAVAYRRSVDELLLAGIDQNSINLFFQNPVMLPVFDFPGSWSEANMGVVAVPESDSSAEQETRLSFKQWSINFPFVGAPVKLGLAHVQASDPGDYAMFSFNLSGLEEVAHWYQGRYKKSISAAQDLVWLDRAFSNPIDPLALEDKIKSMRFRPKLVNGEAQSVSATLLYQFASAP